MRYTAQFSDGHSAVSKERPSSANTHAWRGVSVRSNGSRHETVGFSITADGARLGVEHFQRMIRPRKAIYAEVVPARELVDA